MFTFKDNCISLRYVLKSSPFNIYKSTEDRVKSPGKGKTETKMGFILGV